MSGSIYGYGNRAINFVPGDRVELHPGLDLWMMGARYGDVVRVSKTTGRVTVKLDKVKRQRRFDAADIKLIYPQWGQK